MSWRAWTEPGYGYKLYQNNNLEKIKQFIVDNWDILEESRPIKEIVMECNDETEIEQLLDSPTSYTIAEIINELENTTIFSGYQSCGDTNQDEMLGIRPTYPWFMNGMDKLRTRTDYMKLLKKYGDILGVTEEADYFEAEYCG